VRALRCARIKIPVVTSYSGLNLDPAEVQFCLIHFTISRPHIKRKAQPGAETASAAACAIGFYLSLDAQKRIHNTEE
jgi:hypothetical protein